MPYNWRKSERLTGCRESQRPLTNRTANLSAYAEITAGPKGSFGTSGALAAAPGVITNATLTPGSYCHLTFPAIREETLSWDRPVLKDPSEGDIIDFYGSCDHDPLGKMRSYLRDDRQRSGTRVIEY